MGELWICRYADVEGDGIASLLVDRAEVVPEVTLLADEPTEKKMNKSDGNDQNLIDEWLPKYYPFPLGIVSFYLNGAWKAGDRVLAEAKAALVALGLPIGLVGNPDNTSTAGIEKDLTAEELEAVKSRRIGECETWTRGHELGRAAPIWTNGKGVYNHTHHTTFHYLKYSHLLEVLFGLYVLSSIKTLLVEWWMWHWRIDLLTTGRSEHGTSGNTNA